MRTTVLTAIATIAGFLLFAGNAFGQQEPPPLPPDINLIVGKKVIVQRKPLCEPGTYTPVLTYAGKKATVISVKLSAVPPISSAVMDRLTPGQRAIIESARSAATVLLEFEDGKRLDSCGPIKVSDYVELVPGQEFPASAYAAPAVFTPEPKQPVLEGHTPVGGKWTHFISEEKFSGEKSEVFRILANEQITDGTLSGTPVFDIMCRNGRWINSYLVVPIILGTGVASDNFVGIAMRHDGKINNSVWDIAPDRKTLFAGKGPTQDLLNASDVRIQFPDFNKYLQVALFSPAGIDRDQLNRKHMMNPSGG